MDSPTIIQKISFDTWTKKPNLLWKNIFIIEIQQYWNHCLEDTENQDSSVEPKENSFDSYPSLQIHTRREKWNMKALRKLSLVSEIEQYWYRFLEFLDC